MASVREKVIYILQGNKNKMAFQDLDRELNRTGCLGFGVETTDVVWALEKRGRVMYDRKEGIVYLLKDNSMLFDESLNFFYGKPNTKVSDET